MLLFCRNLGGESVSSLDPSSSMASPLPGTATGLLTPSGDLDLRKISQVSILRIVNFGLESFLCFS
jgi:hypothetical protein